MKTVQLAIRNSEYAQALRNLLLRDGSHKVFVVDRPDPAMDGVIVVDEARFGDQSLLSSEPDRFVVVTHKGANLARVWDAGIRHVVFENDPPNTTQLAVIAAELRLPHCSSAFGHVPAAHGERHHNLSSDLLPIIDRPSRHCCGHRHACGEGTRGCNQC